MQEMMDQAPAWFGKVAPDLHIDTVYSKTLRQAGHSKASKRRAIIHLRRVCCMDAFKEHIYADKGQTHLFKNEKRSRAKRTACKDRGFVYA